MRPSDEALINDVRAVADRVDPPPTLDEYREHGEHAVRTYYDRFGSWRDAVRAAGYDPNHPGGRVPTDRLLAALDRLADDPDDPPTTIEMREEGPHAVSTYVDRFGSWRDAVRAAGFDVPPAPDVDALRAELRRLAAANDAPPTTDTMREDGAYSVATYVDRFGSWNAALAAADLTDRAPDREIADTALCADLRRLSEQLDRAPTTTDVDEYGAYCPRTYYRRFDSWDEALAAADIDRP